MIPHSKPTACENEISRVAEALRNSRFAQGHEVRSLETELCSVFRRKEAVVVSSGTAALFLALTALGLKKHDAVIIPSLTCAALYSAVSYAGGKPICADTAPDNVCITRKTVKKHLAKAKTVIAPHMFGYEADIDGIKALGLSVIEDCAQSAGGISRDGSLMGTKGDISVFSFYATKLIPAGEGGACLTDNHELAETIRTLRNSDEKKLHPLAFNFKMPDITAALALAKLEKLQANLDARTRISDKYDKAFGNKSFRVRHALNQPVCFRYLLELDQDPGAFIEKTLLAGVECRKPVWAPLHYELGGKCPSTELRDWTLVSIPVYPELESCVDEICGKITGCFD